MNKVDINEYIVADAQICHGKPTFKRTRVMAWQVLEMLSEGINKKDIIAAFPSLTDKHIKAALEYASFLTKEGYVGINTHQKIFA